jgi:hypothetical protein
VEGCRFGFFLGAVLGAVVVLTIVVLTIVVGNSGTVEVVVLVVLVVGDLEAADVAGTDGITSAKTTRNISA